MHIVCPHCTTSYAIDLTTLGNGGRTVRCSRCKEVWLARPEDAVAAERAMAEASAQEPDAAAEWEAMAREDDPEQAPEIESPSIANDFLADDDLSSHIDEADWQTMARLDAQHEPDEPRQSWFRRLLSQGSRPTTALPRIKPSTACAALGALAAALIIWRTDVVRLLPQTAAFYRLVGLDVNLRGLLFKNVKITTESVEGKSMLVIEGVIVPTTNKAVDLPRLRFSVRDAQGAEIYAWNTVLEKTVLKPAEHAPFRSRLASPPAEARSVEIRFFNKRDVASGNV
jgi:predicted Zn finger-like uncharacterized protein